MTTMMSSGFTGLYLLTIACYLCRLTGAFSPALSRNERGWQQLLRSSSVGGKRASTELMAAGGTESFGAWEELGECKLLRPGDATTPRAIVHFLGGAFVSPQPTVAYRYILERLAALGYAVVATPFAVDFDYDKPAADIRQKFASAREELSGMGYGSLPLLSVGHSLGALMHVLLACKFPAEFAEGISGAALVSYNNKGVDGAIPGFKEVFVPALGPLEPLTRDQRIEDAISLAQEARTGAFSSARTLARNVRDGLGLKDGESLIPGVSPIVLNAIDDLEAASKLIDQVPDVLASIARGASEFEPTPAEMREIVASSYSLPSPLLVKFADDFIDESDVLMDILPPQLNARLELLQGTHVSPLAIDPNAPTTPLLPIPDPLNDDSLRGALLADADALVASLDNYFSDAIITAEASTSSNNGSADSPAATVDDGLRETTVAKSSTDAAQEEKNVQTEERNQRSLLEARLEMETAGKASKTTG